MPLLKIVFECLYIGAFPMAVLLMLTPAGTAIFRSYVTGLVWLQSWGPLYAILHRIAMGEAAERMSAAAAMPGGDIGISLVAQAGMGERIGDAELRGDHDEADRLTRERSALVSFFPIVEHAFGEDAKKGVFQFQMMTDFQTVVGIAPKLLLEFG